MTLDLPSARQRELLDAWLPGAVTEHDHSWGLVDRVVLEVVCSGSRFIVKAGGSDDHHGPGQPDDQRGADCHSLRSRC